MRHRSAASPVLALAVTMVEASFGGGLVLAARSTKLRSSSGMATLRRAVAVAAVTATAEVELGAAQPAGP